MNKDAFRANKLPGKTTYSGRRRSATRRAGFNSHPDSTGGEFRIEEESTLRVEAGEVLALVFEVPATDEEHFVGFGAWFIAPAFVAVTVEGCPAPVELSQPGSPNWSKVGSMWRGGPSGGDQAHCVAVKFRADQPFDIALYDAASGHIRHKHLEGAKAVLLRNMHRFSPEANFYSEAFRPAVTIDGKGIEGRAPSGEAPLHLKTCNRCARYLPINVDDERQTLSFSNHCVAAHRRPCRHGGFGVLRNPNTGKTLQLEFGFQLECRFCKKFEVNAAHNPQRTVAQMKEDAQRRRAFELLLTDLLGGSPQLLYRHETGRELADDIWKRFGKKCFNCDTPLPNAKKMHLDHTRPLALLWPLDKTATALCGNCNSAKRDRYPADFYKEVGKLQALSNLTGIPLMELEKPQPNAVALDLLAQRLDWFFGSFLQRPEHTRERDGKITGELIVKALQKAINSGPAEKRLDLAAAFDRLRAA